MSAYLSYCRTLGFGKYLLLTVLMSLSVMSKPQAATFPFAMLLLDLWPLSRWKMKQTDAEAEPARFTQRSFIGLCMEKLPLIVLCIFFMGLTWFFKSQTGNLLSEEVFPLDVRLANAVDAYAVYARQMVWPNDLQFFYPHSHLLNAKQGIPVSQWGSSLAIVVVISIVAMLQMRKRPYLIIGWCWFLGILVPAIGLVQVGEYARADRYMYIPLLGLTILFVQLLEEMLSRLPARRSMAVVSGLIVVGSLMAMAVPQAESWRNTEAMCRHALSVDENNYMAYTLLSQDVLKRSTRNKEEKMRNAEMALKYLAKSKEIMPRFAPTEQAIGLTLIALGRDDEACEAFRKSLDIDPNYSLSYLNIAIVSARQGKYQQAIESLLEVDRREATVSAFTKEVAWVKLSSYYRRLGEEAKSLEYDRKVYALNPRRVDALERIAWSLATSSDDNIRDAVQALELATRLNRLHREKSPKALDTLAAAYAEAGNFSEALEVSAKAHDIARRAKNEKLLKEIVKRQQLYQAGKPFRQKVTPGKA
ncbi:MAG: tetratricopeptide repeat protein [Planctomycetota bacterium]|nr:tetratricopeptide repeat protein [Planctomycetota bacterium]